MNKGKLYIVSGPSGSGKDTVVGLVMQKLGDESRISVSMTTRQPRGQEKEGVDYFYVSEESFLNNVEQGNMLEYARYGRYYYGTPKAPVEKWLEEGKVVFLVIEVNGGENIKKYFPDAEKIFILPPSLGVLEQRLRGRGTEDDDAVSRRMTIAREEIKRAVEYDYIIVNDLLDDAVNSVISIVEAQKLRTANMKNKISEVLENA
ncbi:MAG: guanylate kinase [Clostridia bacterium]|nr:guanylate kinase [Clostridia bacterium]